MTPYPRLQLLPVPRGDTALTRPAAPFVPVRTTEAQLPRYRGTGLGAAAAFRPRNIACLAVATMVLSALVALGLPVASAWSFALAPLLYLGLVVRDLADPSFLRTIHGPLGAPLEPSIQPSDLHGAELGLALHGVLQAHECVRLTLNASPALVEAFRDVYGRCGELVDAAARVARSGDSLQAFLSGESAVDLEHAVARLDTAAAQTADEQAKATYGRAAAMRRRQLATYRQIDGLYERVTARLALVTAFLAAFEATVVRLRALDQEDIHAAGAAIAQQLDDLEGEVDVLRESVEGAIP